MFFAFYFLIFSLVLVYYSVYEIYFYSLLRNYFRDFFDYKYMINEEFKNHFDIID